MDHQTLLQCLSRPLDQVDPDTLHRALTEHRVCTPPAPAGKACDEWVNQWPADAVEAVGRFMEHA